MEVNPNADVSGENDDETLKNGLPLNCSDKPTSSPIVFPCF